MLPAQLDSINESHLKDLVPSFSFDIARVREPLLPIGRRGCNPSVNFDGQLFSATVRTGEAVAYVQLFRNGVIEAVDCVEPVGPYQWSPDGSRHRRAPSRDAAIAFPTTCSGSGPSAHGFRHARRAIQCPIRSALLRLRRRNRPRGSASSCGQCNHPEFVCPRCDLRAGRGGRRSAACRRGGQP